MWEKGNLVKAMVLAAALAVAFLGVSAGTARADTIISAQFENNQSPGTTVNYSGVEPDAAKADSAFANSNVWNHLQAGFSVQGPFSFSNLVNSAGAGTGASFAISYINGAFNASGGLPDTYFFAYNTTQTFTFSGLAPNESVSLFLYAFNGGSSNDQGTVFSVGSSSFDTANGSPSSEDSKYAVTGMLTGVTSATGTIAGTWAFGPGNAGNEIDWSGFQLDVASPAKTVTPEPASLMLFGTGLLGLAWVTRRRMRASAANEL
ncbi:MAG: PEP-CTERM sorting domain-containing protein [Terriglobia bacterium]